MARLVIVKNPHKGSISRRLPSRKKIKEFYNANKNHIYGTFNEFYPVFVTHWRQHENYPQSITTMEVDTKQVPCKANIFSNIGQLDNLDYIAPKGSRKNEPGKNIVYRHKCKKTIVVSDSKGNIFILGSTKIDLQDGWMH